MWKRCETQSDFERFVSGTKNNLPQFYLNGPNGEVQWFNIRAMETRKIDSSVEFWIYEGVDYEVGVCLIKKPTVGMVKVQTGYMKGNVTPDLVAGLWSEAVKTYAAKYGIKIDGWYTNFPKDCHGDAFGFTKEAVNTKLSADSDMTVLKEWEDSELTIFSEKVWKK